MDNFPLPNAEKKRRVSESKHPIREKLLSPKTWKVATSVLEFVLKLIEGAAKLLEMLG